MKIVAVSDLFVRTEHYEECLSKYPEFELKTVYFGYEDRFIMRDIFHRIERNGPDAYPIPEELYELIEDADVLMVHVCPVPESLLARAKKLRVILTNRGGLENIDVEAATKRGISILNNPAHNANGVSELAMGLMISLTRNVIPSHNGLINGEWKENYRNTGNIWELKGKTVGIIGFGNIGHIMAEKLNVFGCKLLVNDIKYDPDDEMLKRLPIKQVDLPTLMAESDVVTLHARSEELILTREMLSLMKPTAFFLNTARAHMVDYNALADLLKEGKIMGAAMDVHPVEPIPEDYPFLKMDNVIITTHRCGDTLNAYSDSPDMLMEDYMRYLAGKKPRFYVNPELGFTHRLRNPNPKMDGKKLLMGAHRGDRKNFPENTMLAMKAAHELGCDIIETDVRMTSDRHLVLIHDRDVDRTTNGTGKIDQMTLAEVRALDAGVKKDAAFAGEKIPTVEEFLEFVSKTDMLVNWELKEYPCELGERAYECADKLIELIDKYGMADRSMMNSFSQKILEYIWDKWQDKFVIHGYIGYEKWDVSEKPLEAFTDWVAIWRKNEDNPVGFASDYKHADMHACPTCILVPDTVERYKAAMDMGCRMFTSDDPAKGIEVLKELGQR